MAKMTLSERTFSLISEGTHVFKIMEVDDSKYEDFGKISVKMQTEEGKTHIERFSLTKANGSLNEGALKAWSFFARTCLNNMNAEEIDTQDIVGCYISAEVKHETYTKQDGTEGTSERLNKYKVATSFKPAQTATPVETTSDDIGDDDDLDFD